MPVIEYGHDAKFSSDFSEALYLHLEMERLDEIISGLLKKRQSKKEDRRVLKVLSRSSSG